MLYAGSSWSELSISVAKEQEANGEEYLYELVIDGALPMDLEIQRGNSLELYITQKRSFSVYAYTEIAKDLEIEQNQTWNLL
jgi:hypothetical protein